MRRTVVHYAPAIEGGAAATPPRPKMRLRIPRGISRAAKKKLQEAHKRLRKIGVDLYLARNEALPSGNYYLETAAEAFYAARDKTYEHVPGPAPASMWAQVRIPHKRNTMSSGQKMLYFNHDLKRVSGVAVDRVMRSVFGAAYSWNGTSGKSMGVNLAALSPPRRASTPRRRRSRSSPSRKSMKRRIARRRRASSSSPRCPMGEGLKYYKPSRLSPPRPANHAGCRGKTICNSNGCWTSTPNSRGVHSWRIKR